MWVCVRPFLPFWLYLRFSIDPILGFRGDSPWISVLWEAESGQIWGQHEEENLGVRWDFRKARVHLPHQIVSWCLSQTPWNLTTSWALRVSHWMCQLQACNHKWFAEKEASSNIHTHKCIQTLPYMTSVQLSGLLCWVGYFWWMVEPAVALTKTQPAVGEAYAQMAGKTASMGPLFQGLYRFPRIPLHSNWFWPYFHANATTACCRTTWSTRILDKSGFGVIAAGLSCSWILLKGSQCKKTTLVMRNIEHIGVYADPTESLRLRSDLV